MDERTVGTEQYEQMAPEPLFQLQWYREYNTMPSSQLVVEDLKGEGLAKLEPCKIHKAPILLFYEVVAAA